MHQFGFLMSALLAVSFGAQMDKDMPFTGHGLKKVRNEVSGATSNLPLPGKESGAEWSALSPDVQASGFSECSATGTKTLVTAPTVSAVEVKPDSGAAGTTSFEASHAGSESNAGPRTRDVRVGPPTDRAIDPPPFCELIIGL